MWYSYNTFSSLGLRNPRANFQTTKAKSASARGWCALIKNSVWDEWFSVGCLSSKMQMIVASCVKMTRGWHGASGAPFGQRQGVVPPQSGRGKWHQFGLSLSTATWLGVREPVSAGHWTTASGLFPLCLVLSLADPTEEPARIVKIGMI